jgi:hypothetical protein
MDDTAQPNQNLNNNTTNQPANTDNSSVPETQPIAIPQPEPVVPPTVDTPPVFTTVEDVPPAPAQPMATPVAGGAGPQDEQIPSLANNYYSPKGGGVNTRMITGLLGIIVLTLAVGVGTFLALNNQNPQKKAAYENCPDGSAITWCAHFECPNGDTDGDRRCGLGDDGATQGGDCGTGGCGQTDFYNGQPNDYTSFCMNSFNGGFPNCGGNGDGDGEVTEWCDDVKAFDANGNQLGNNALSQLQPGTTITFGIKGQPTGRDYNRARFTINGGDRETTTDKEAGIGYALDYIIPANVTSFSIKGAVHHTAKDRWINKQKNGSDCKLNFELGAVSSPSPSPSVSPSPSPSPTPPGVVSAQCLEIKIYDSEWTQIMAADLVNLKSGDVIRVAAAGSPADQFDQAQFTINGTQRAAVTQKKTGTDEYYDEYTLESNVTTFSISVKLHHLVLGWI